MVLRVLASRQRGSRTLQPRSAGEAATRETSLRSIALSWRTILGALGYDPDDPHMVESPERVARFMLDWHTNHHTPEPTLTVFPARGYSQVVTCSGIRFHSLCAHHGLPFFGTGALGYLPRDKILGLSKLARVLDYYSRRFQTQEDLTRAIADHLARALRPRGVAVVLRAEHLCMSMRGINRPGHETTTSEMRGLFRSSASARAEVLGLLGVTR